MQQIQENILNNNSVVAKLNYKNFSILFTGDIEEIAEKQILEEYKNNLQVLKSTILKVRTSWLKNIKYKRIFGSSITKTFTNRSSEKIIPLDIQVKMY